MKMYRAKKEYILREIAGEPVLVSTGEGIANFCGVVRLNASAKVLWETLKEGATLEYMAQKLMSIFGISRDRADADVMVALILLLEHGLVVAC